LNYISLYKHLSNKLYKVMALPAGYP